MSPTAETSRWYAVQTQPLRELRAEAELVKQGFEVFLPRYLKRWTHARRTASRPTPLFPRYLFVAIDVERQRWRSINGTIGVVRIVGTGARPTPVPSAVIDELEHRRATDGLISLGRPG